MYATPTYLPGEILRIRLCIKNNKYRNIFGNLVSRSGIEWILYRIFKNVSLYHSQFISKRINEVMLLIFSHHKIFCKHMQNITFIYIFKRKKIVTRKMIPHCRNIPEINLIFYLLTYANISKFQSQNSGGNRPKGCEWGEKMYSKYE